MADAAAADGRRVRVPFKLPRGPSAELAVRGSGLKIVSPGSYFKLFIPATTGIQLSKYAGLQYQSGFH